MLTALLNTRGGGPCSTTRPTRSEIADDDDGPLGMFTVKMDAKWPILVGLRAGIGYDDDIVRLLAIKGCCHPEHRLAEY